MKNKSNAFYILILVFIGLVSIPLDMLPSQIMNDLTQTFTSSISAKDSQSFIFPWGVIALFLFSTVAVASINAFKSALTDIVKEDLIRIRTIELFNRIMHVSPTFFRKNDPPKIANRIINDTSKVEGFYLDLKLRLPLAMAGLLYFSYVMFAGLEISPSTPILGSWFGGGGSIVLSCTGSDGREIILQRVNGKYTDMPEGSLKIRAVPNTNYEFKGWKALKDVSVANSSSAITALDVAGKGELRAIFEKKAESNNRNDKNMAELIHVPVVSSSGIASVQPGKRALSVEITPQGFSQTGNWLLALLIVLLAPLRSFFVFFDKKIQKIYQSSSKAEDDLRSVTAETLGNVKEIRNNFAFDFAMTRLGSAFNRLRAVEVDIIKLTALFSGIRPLIDGIITCSMLGLGVYMCCIAEPKSFLGLVVSPIEWKDYLGFAGMAICVNGYISGMFVMLFQWRMNKESIRRINEFKKEPEIFSEAKGLPVDGTNSPIEFCGLALSIDEVRILNNLSFLINAGKHVAFVGPSGCGKSTAMNLIIRDLSQTCGELKFGGKRIGDCDFMSLTQEVGHVQQKPAIFNLSLRENILLCIRRSSSKTVADKDGPLDVSKLPGCSTIDDINALLIDVTKKAELADDIIKKAFDNPVPEKYLDSPPIVNIVQARSEIAKKLSLADSNLVVIYSPCTFLRESTLLENLLYGRIKKQEKEDEQAPAPNEICAKALFESLRNNPSLMKQLLALGHKVICQDKQIADCVMFTTPRLKLTLLSLRIEKDTKDGLEDKLGFGTVSDADLLKLDDGCKIALISISLGLDSKRAMDMLGDTGDFEKQIIAHRQSLRGNPPRAIETIVTRFDAAPGQLAGSLSFREFLLNGQVNSSVHDAVQTVDGIIESVFREMKMHDILYLMGLEFPAGPGGNALSGGLSMKVAIARILFKKPNVLLLDEATAALDNKSQARIVSMIEREFKGKTVIAIAHRLSMIKNFDNIIVFDKGRVSESGSYDELLSRKGLFYNLVLLDREEPQQAGVIAPPADKQDTPDGNIPASAELCRSIALSPIFKDLTGGQIRLIENLSAIVECREGETLFMPGDEGNKLYIILSGTVDFFSSKNDDGTFVTVDSYGEGQSFGEIALFGEGTRTLGAVAKTKLRLCVISREAMFDIIKMTPDIALNIIKTLSIIITKDRVRYGVLKEKK